MASTQTQIVTFLPDKRPIERAKCEKNLHVKASDKRFRPSCEDRKRMSLSISLDEDFFVERSHGSCVVGDKQLAAMARDHPGELILGKTNVTTLGLTKFIEELTTGYRRIPVCTLSVNPARCNITAIMYGCKARFNSMSGEYEIHINSYPVHVLVTRFSSKTLEPFDVCIKTFLP